MKNKANTVRTMVPLVAGSVITRGSITLGMGHVCEYVVTYDGPSQPLPARGAVWPPETDWPAAKMTVLLSGVNYSGDTRLNIGQTCYYPHPDLTSGVRVAGETITDTWGDSSAVNRRSRTYREAGSSLRTLAAGMVSTLRHEVRPLQAHLAARAARIAQREQTLASGNAGVRAVKAA